MAHHVSFVMVHITRWSALRSRTYVQRIRVGAPPPTVVQLEKSAFLTPLAVNSGVLSRLYFPTYVVGEVIYANPE
jgi:hypothetical protein